VPYARVPGCEVDVELRRSLLFRECEQDED